MVLGYVVAQHELPDITAEEPDDKCVHQATIPCGTLLNTCPGTPKLTGSPCCGTPGFNVETFLIPALNFCSRVDQTGCAGGLVDYAEVPRAAVVIDNQLLVEIEKIHQLITSMARCKAATRASISPRVL